MAKNNKVCRARVLHVFRMASTLPETAWQDAGADAARYAARRRRHGTATEEDDNGGGSSDSGAEDGDGSHDHGDEEYGAVMTGQVLAMHDTIVQSVREELERREARPDFLAFYIALCSATKKFRTPAFSRLYRRWIREVMVLYGSTWNLGDAVPKLTDIAALMYTGTLTSGECVDEDYLHVQLGTRCLPVRVAGATGGGGGGSSSSSSSSAAPATAGSAEDATLSCDRSDIERTWVKLPARPRSAVGGKHFIPARSAQKAMARLRPALCGTALMRATEGLHKACPAVPGTELETLESRFGALAEETGYVPTFSQQRKRALSPPRRTRTRTRTGTQTQTDAATAPQDDETDVRAPLLIGTAYLRAAAEVRKALPDVPGVRHDLASIKSRLAALKGQRPAPTSGSAAEDRIRDRGGQGRDGPRQRSRPVVPTPSNGPRDSADDRVAWELWSSCPDVAPPSVAALEARLASLRRG